jgi:hypothetical protein
VIWHLVLLTPRADLPTAERRRFADAFRRAVTEIPSVRTVRFGRRVTHGAGDEQDGRATPFIAIIEFDDQAGLQAYLSHASHDELAAHFGRFLSSAIVYDFEMLAEKPAELRGALEPFIEES